jgi:hypothetical protein
MEINLGSQRLVRLGETYSADQIQGLALTKRIDAFGQMAKLFSRPRPEDIEVGPAQKRFEPFWYAAATARYAYDRRHAYRIEVPAGVQAVTLLGQEFSVATGGRAPAIEVEATNFCVDEERRELLIDGVQGQESHDLRRYLTFEKIEVDDLATLEQGGAIVVQPAVLGSFVVRKLVSTMMKTFHADLIREEKIDVEELVLYYRPVYVVEYTWKAKDKRQLLDFDALTGESHAEPTQVKRQVIKALENDALFDIGADTIGMLVPGSNIAIKVTRFAARKAIR